jgi:very-short-patch-repair endonuclease
MTKTPKERLAERLTAMGWRHGYGGGFAAATGAVEASDIRTPEGAWKRENVCRWEAGLVREEHPRLSTWITSWQTVANCARLGFTLAPETRAKRQGGYEPDLLVFPLGTSAKGRTTKPAAVSALELSIAPFLPAGFLPQVKIGHYRVDYAHPKRKIVIEVNGCFWHGCPIHSPTPTHQRQVGVQEEDLRKELFLRRRGWLVLTLWEHDIKADAVAAISALCI